MNIMHSILWIVFASCIMLQRIAGYRIKIEDIKSNTEFIDITEDATGAMTMTLNKEKDGSTFKAEFFESKEGSPLKTIEGKVCKEFDATDEGLVAEILRRPIAVKGCPVPAGEYSVTKDVKIESNAFDEFLPTGFNEAYLEVRVYAAGNDHSGTEDTHFKITLYENDD